MNASKVIIILCVELNGPRKDAKQWVIAVEALNGLQKRLILDLQNCAVKKEKNYIVSTAIVT